MTKEQALKMIEWATAYADKESTKFVHAGNKNTYESNGYCQAFVASAYYHGYEGSKSYVSKSTARNAYNDWGIIGKDKDNIPVGAVIYWNTSKNGHIGIYLGGGYCVSALGTIKRHTIDALKKDSGEYKGEYLGWGWYNNDEIEGSISDKDAPDASASTGNASDALKWEDEWGVDRASVSDVSSLEKAAFSREDLEITDDMYIGSDVIRKVKDKCVEFGAGYLIYFDDVLMNRYVTSFSATIGTTGNIETASVEVIYTPTFWKTEIRDSKTNLYKSSDAIENQTSVRIFVMNVITRKFDIIFDGVLKMKQRRKSPRGKSVVFTAKCHMDWLNRISVPVAIPLGKTLSIGDQIRWLAQGIDLQSIDTVIFNKEASFKGKTLTQFLSEQINKTFTNNFLFKDPNTVAKWDDPANRFCIMGDIDPQLVAAECIDFLVSASTEIVDTMYTVVNRIVTTLLIECFSDRDGLIRVKPPYWNQPVLKDHVIDPMFILDQADITNYDDFYTRIIATGGNEEWDSSAGTRGAYVQSDFLTPVGAYVGNMQNSEDAFWADFTGVRIRFGVTNGVNITDTDNTFSIVNDDLINNAASNITEAEQVDNDFSYLNQFLIPSDDERKYGPRIYEVTQSLIKFATSKGVQESANPAMALRKYAQFMYYMLNSSLDTSSITTIAMPWLRPGFNIWLNPMDDDKIYYINEISYVGGPESGVTSSLSLSLGRERRVFATEESAFGAQKDKCDNLLISEFMESQTVDKFGTVIKDNDEFESLKESCFEFYSNDDTVVGAEYSEYFKNLYGSVNSSPNAFAVSSEGEKQHIFEVSGVCEKAAANEESLKKLNESQNINGRILLWPVMSNMISNGYDKEKHPGIDIFCGAGVDVGQEYLDVSSMCKIRVINLEKNSKGYVLTGLIMDTVYLNSNNILDAIVTYAHIDEITNETIKNFDYTEVSDKIRNKTLGNSLDGLYEIKFISKDIINGCPELDSASIFAKAKGDLHISLRIRKKQEQQFNYVDITEYLNREPVESMDNVVYNSDLYEDSESLTKPVTNTDKVTSQISPFCESKKFFSKEMSFEEIDTQIKELYSGEDVPAVIKNRSTALKARMAEAERFVQRFYDSENLSVWQDVQKLSEYVSQNQGYKTGEWVEGAYKGNTIDNVNATLAMWEAQTTYTAGALQAENVASGERTEANITVVLSNGVVWNNNAEKVYYLLRDKYHYNDAICAGILANMCKESTFDYLNQTGDSGNAWGLCQWNDRRQRMVDWCSRYYGDWKSIEAQVAFMVHEFKTTEYSTFGFTIYNEQGEVAGYAENDYKRAYDAGKDMCTLFERPSKKEEKGKARGQLAKDYYSYITNSTEG